VAKGNDVIEVEGKVLEALPGGKFKIKILNENWPEENREITGFISGKMRKFSIKILPGDKVKMELSPYDLSIGRIVFREK